MSEFGLTAPARTIFGRDCRGRAVELIPEFGCRLLLVRGGSVGWAEDLASALSTSDCALEVLRSQGEPDLAAVRQGVSVARAHRADCVVAVGGGSVIDLGKAVAGLCSSSSDPVDYLELGDQAPARLENPVPFVAIPTTAGTGAEATRNAVIGVPERQAKISLRDPRLVPDLAIVDPALTDGCPKALTLASGLDAITQLIESYLCNRANPLTDALTAATIPGAITALVTLMRSEDPKAREVMSRASYLSGVALANSGLGVVHGLASVIGGYGGAHGAICGRLLASALQVNAAVAQRQGLDTARFRQVDHWLSDVFGESPGDGVQALRAFVDDLDLPGLGELGVPSDRMSEIAQRGLSASSTRANPAPLDQRDLEEVLRNAG